MWRDDTWHASMREGPKNILPSWSRSYEIGSKVLLPVIEPRAEVSQVWLSQFPRYILARHYRPTQDFFFRFEWGRLFTIKVPTRIHWHTFPEFEVYFKGDRATRRLLYESPGNQFLPRSELKSSRLSRSFQDANLRCSPTIPCSRRSRSRPDLELLQLQTKATSAILEVSTLPAHGQSTRDVSYHKEITHLTGARYPQALEMHNLRLSEANSIESNF